MIKNKRELLDSLIQPSFTYLGRCEKLPDRRPDGSKLVNGDVFTLDTKEKCGKDTITISNEYVYSDNEWIELPDIPQPKVEYPSMLERYSTSDLGNDKVEKWATSRVCNEIEELKYERLELK